VKEILQPGMHPDADRMSTFMEGSATAQEREEMLAHLAECGECRRVVFLMQEAEQPRLPHAETANARGWMGRWLMPAGLAGAALACGLATLVYVRTHRGTGEMVGQNAQVHSPAPVAPDLSKSEAPAGTGGQETAPKPENRASKRARGAGEAAQAAGGSGGAASGVSGVSVGNGAKVEARSGSGSVNKTAPDAGDIANLNARAAAVPAQVPLPGREAAEMKQAPIAAMNAPGSPSYAAANVISALRIEHDRGPDDGTSEVSGRVTDRTGAVVAGATVMLRDPAGKTRLTTSSADGSFTLTGVSPGHYELNVMARGFQAYQQAIDLKPRDVAMLDTPLTVGAETQTVTVQADAMAVQTDSNAVGTLIASDKVSEVPTENRNFAALASLPSGMPAGSTATLGKRVLSLDSAGTLFASHNGGKSWKEVKPKWSGKVARIEVVNASDDARKTERANAESARALFQLTTDAGAVWDSRDGTHWRAR